MSKQDPLRTDELGRAWLRQIGAIIENTPPPARRATIQAIVCAAATLLEEQILGKGAAYFRIVADELDRETKPPRQLDEETADDPAKAEPQTRAIILAAENADLARQVNAAKRETRKKTAELGAALELYETMKADRPRLYKDAADDIDAIMNQISAAGAEDRIDPDLWNQAIGTVERLLKAAKA